MLQRISVIIVAGGSGTRMGGVIPKQFMLLDGIPVLAHSIKKFRRYLSGAKLIVVLPEAQIPCWKAICHQYRIPADYEIVAGGETRFESVRNGLSRAGACDFIFVHDGVRPLFSGELVRNCLEALRTHEAVVPVVPVTDSLRIINGGTSVAVDRSLYWHVQTPQCFRADTLLTAYEQAVNNLFTDEASVVEASGKKIHLIDGAPENLKITTPSDLLVAEYFLKANPVTVAVE